MVHIGRGDKPAGLAYVTNVVNVLLRAADSDRSVGQAYNASDGSNVTWRQYVDRLAEIVGVASPRVVIPYPVAYLVGWAMEKTYGALGTEARPLLTRTAVALFGTNQGFPVDKARRELGYEPEVNFEEGMRRTAIGSLPWGKWEHLSSAVPRFLGTAHLHQVRPSILPNRHPSTADRLQTHEPNE